MMEYFARFGLDPNFNSIFFENEPAQKAQAKPHKLLDHLLLPFLEKTTKIAD